MEEDREFWFWKGQMFAAGPWRDRMVAVNTKMNIVHAHVESYRHTLQAILDGYDGMEDLRASHRNVQFWLRMTGFWALGAVDHHRSTGRLNKDRPRITATVADDSEMVPVLSVKWRD